MSKPWRLLRIIFPEESRDEILADGSRIVMTGPSPRRIAAVLSACGGVLIGIALSRRALFQSVRNLQHPVVLHYPLLLQHMDDVSPRTVRVLSVTFESIFDDLALPVGALTTVAAFVLAW